MMPLSQPSALSANTRMNLEVIRNRMRELEGDVTTNTPSSASGLRRRQSVLAAPSNGIARIAASLEADADETH